MKVDFGIAVIRVATAAAARMLAKHELDFGAHCWGIEDRALIKYQSCLVFGAPGFRAVPVLRIEW